MATVEETTAALEQARRELDEKQAAYDAAMRASKPARKPEVILHEFLQHVASRFGNHPDLVALLNELESAFAPASPLDANAQQHEETVQ